jgi:hypothetical protein
MVESCEMMDAYHTALSWHAAGVACIPILARQKTPALASWMPYTERLPTARELRAWFHDTAYNIAVLTGRGLVILDWDDTAAYGRWLDSLDGRRALADTFAVLTSRGVHLYYWVDEETRCVHGNGWDVKGHHGYCLTVPSIHPSGAHYRGGGDLSAINPLPSIAAILPAYAARIEEMERTGALSRDPLAAAMRVPSTDIGKPIDFERIKATLPWSSMLSGLQHRYTRIHANCPLHPDDHASFVVYPDGHYHCFGCGAHGRDQIDLYAAIHGLDIGAAIAELAGRV